MVAMTAQVLTGLRSSPACERNAAAVASVLADWIGGRQQLLEVGSGTGQHASACIADHPQLQWQTSDHEPDVATIRGWANTSAAPDRITGPEQLNVNMPEQWASVAGFDVCFTANTLHIMPWSVGRALFANAARHGRADCLLLIYGPFHVDGKPTSAGNARFDAALRAEHEDMGIRNIEDVRSEAARCGWLERVHYHMPANNQMLVFQTSQEQCV